MACMASVTGGFQASMKRLLGFAAFVLAFGPELFALLAVQPLGVGLVAASLGDGLLIHARRRGGCRMICRRLGTLRKSNTSSDSERKNYCRDDSRFRHHIFLPTMWNVVGSNRRPLTYQACVSSSSPIGAMLITHHLRVKTIAITCHVCSLTLGICLHDKNLQRMSVGTARPGQAA
jgi:hypothetical protein